VWVARDGELNRQVALKKIRPEFADQPAARARFMLEAMITGGLEHPGIVPVYSLGISELQLQIRQGYDGNINRLGVEGSQVVEGVLQH
jgi:serine/threonine protein kinase